MMDTSGDPVLKDEGPMSDYARELTDRLTLAWETALGATQAAQWSDVEASNLKRDLRLKFEKGDRVLLKIETRVPKLEWIWSGPYRVAEVLPNDVYTLRDLPNKRIIPDVHVSRLRDYLTVVDAVPLADDEFLVEKILEDRLVSGERQYRIKWTGFPLSQATWEPEGNLLVRCADMLMTYQRTRLKTEGVTMRAEMPKLTRKERRELKATKYRARAERRARDDEKFEKNLDMIEMARDDVVITNEVEKEPAQLPSLKASMGVKSPVGPQKASSRAISTRLEEAKYERGAWHYRVVVSTSRGPSSRWLPSYKFSEVELEEARPLRQAFYDAATPKVRALMEARGVGGA